MDVLVAIIFERVPQIPAFSLLTSNCFFQICHPYKGGESTGCLVFLLFYCFFVLKMCFLLLRHHHHLLHLLCVIHIVLIVAFHFLLHLFLPLPLFILLSCHPSSSSFFSFSSS